MKNPSDTEKKYRTILGGDQSKQRESEENCFKFLKYLFCFYNLCLLVGYVALPIASGKDVCVMYYITTEYYRDDV